MTPSIGSYSVGTTLVLFGVGDGTFIPSGAYPMSATLITIADVNQDGYPDILGGAGQGNVLLGNSDGTFKSALASPTDAPLAPNGTFPVTITDTDGDGKPDIVGTNPGFYPGNGDGTFRAQTANIYAFATGILVLGDFNGDGIVDFAMTDTEGLPISVYSGNLSPLLTLTASPDPANVGDDVVLTVASTLADVTGTISFNDKSAGVQGTGVLGTVPLINGSATLRLPHPARGIYSYQASYGGDSKYVPTVSPIVSGTVQQPIGITLSTSANPALPGLPITLTATLSTFPGNATVIFLDGVIPLGFQVIYSTQATFAVTLAAGVHQLRVVFPSYQGYETTSASYTETVTALGGGTLSQGESYVMSATPTGIATADFTGDGLADVVVVSSTGQSLSFFAGTGAGILESLGTTVLDFTPGAIIAGPLQFNYSEGLAITDPDHNAIHTFIYYSGGTFLPSISYNVGVQPVAIATADLDGDGLPDLITANAGSNNVSLVLASGSILTVEAGRHPDAVVTGDFNNDGNTDFAVANRDDNTVDVFLGNGSGGFQMMTAITVGSGPVAIAVSDLNSDGKADMAVVNGTAGQITILLGDGDGTFSAGPVISAFGASTIALVQLTSSGYQDLAVTTSSGLLVFHGNGDGTFQSPMNFPQYAGGVSTAGSFVLDGRMDLAVTVPGANSMALLLNEAPSATSLSVSPSSGVTGGKVTLNINVTPASAIGWFTCYDGTSLVGSGFVVNGAASLTTSLLAPGQHSLSAHFAGVGFSSGYSTSVAYTIQSLPSTGLLPAVTHDLINLPLNLVSGDFNNDGVIDFAFQRSGNGLITLIGSPGGHFTEQSAGAGGGTPAVAADFNRDGFTDLAYVPIFALVATGNGSGDFQEPATLSNSTRVTPAALAAADLDGDSIPDLVIADPDGNVDVLLGVGDGNFQPTRAFPSGGNPTALAVGDFNEDGLPDIIVANDISSAGGAVNVLSGTGFGAFAISQTLSIGAKPVSIAIGDFNGDHHTDAALVNTEGNTITLLFGKGDGTFKSDGTLPLPSTPAKILTVDMDGDGVPDLVVLFTTASPAFAVFYGDGDGSFQPAAVFQTSRIPVDFAAGDVDNDGRMDIVIASESANFEAHGIDVFLGTGNAGAVSQTITFGELGNQTLGTAPFALSAVTASSGLRVVFASNTMSVCTVFGTTVTIIASGGCSLTATQPGSASYTAAVPVTRSFTVLFSDVSPSDIFYSEINAFAQRGITTGCGNNNFCATENVTRDQMAIFIVRSIYGSDNFSYTTTPYFTDVQPSTFGFKWIQKLRDLGITSGCTVTTYCPTNTVTRDQMAVFIIRARLGVSIAGPTPTFTYPSTPYFTDATPGNEFAFPWIQRMKLENITSGCTSTTYCSSAPVTRGEMATFIMRGALNQFLPAGTPVISQISPSTLPVGTSGTYTITGVNTNFVQGTTALSPIPGVTLGTITVNSPTSMTVQLSAASNAVAQPYSILAITGSEQDVLPNGLLLQ